MRRLISVLLFAFLLLPFQVESKTTSKVASTSKSTKAAAAPKAPKAPKVVKAKSPKTSKKSTVAARDKKGKIARSEAAKNSFKKQTGFPKGRKGYVIDHIVPLECGGADAASNMQWQTVAEAKIKDRTEMNCRK